MKFNKSIFLLTLIALSLSAKAANNDDDFQNWLQQENASLKEFKDARDKEFTSFLEKQWKEMEIYSGVVRDTTPKPLKMPIAKPKPVKLVPVPVIPVPDKKPIVDAKPVIKPIDVKKPTKQTKPQHKPKPIIVKKPVVTKIPLPIIVKVPQIKKPKLPAPVKPIPIAKLPKGKGVKVQFFGNPLTFSADPKLKIKFNRRINEKNISAHWAKLSKTDYEEIIKQLSRYKAPLQLNDWGYALLVNSLAQVIYPKSKNEQNLFTWFILLKSSYKARIAYNFDGIYMLFPTEQKVYGAPYFVLNGQRYYSLSFDGSRQKVAGVLTYQGDYPNTDSNFDMRLTKALNTKSNAKTRKLSFKYNRKKYTLKIGLDNNVVRFFKTYPQLDINLYFNSEVNKKIGTELLSQLRPLINGKSEVEALNILLRFVQTSFKYQTDGKQFGKENYLFLEETIFYPFSDCEDRSIMFAWLVRNLLNVDVIGLNYPGHIATAVQIKSNITGDGFMHNGKKYIVADPIYINANIGQAMPAFKKYKPKVVPIKSF